ncbi:MAG: mannosyl-3-phosphoglycerate synthase [Candidatus Bathyarchaeia archaeon]
MQVVIKRYDAEGQVYMKLELPRHTERFGSVKINDIQRVLLLDSAEDGTSEQTGVCSIPRNKLQDIQRKMAIVIPVKDEKLKIVEGVLSAIPSECLVILVSNSTRKGVDRFRIELDMVEQHVHYTKRNIWMIHQRDPKVAEALKRIEYTELLDEQGQVRNGKTEGMILGMLLAKAAEKDYVGFVDADNYVPGAVHEYVSIYAAGFHLSRSPYSMIRISWASKPKVLEGSLYFSKWGRVSAVTNKYLNRVISSFTGFETEVVKTSNSGEHAMTMKLAEILDFQPKFATEPSEIVSILENFGGIMAPTFTEPMEQGVEVFQIETRNPHFHEERGEEHLRDMLVASLSTVLSSSLCSDTIRKEIAEEFSKEQLRARASEEAIKPFVNADAKSFLHHIAQNNTAFSFGEKA